MPFKRVLAVVNAWIPGPGERPSLPVDPGYGIESPVDPGYGHPGWGPVDPGFGVGIGGGRPDNSLPWAPVRPGNKPPGRPILPPHIDNGLPPSAPVHPWVPGHWEPVDPGWGKPPLWAFFPVDPGFGIEETPPPTAGTPLPPSGGNWVPTDPDYGMPERPCGGGKPHPPLWGWIPDQPLFPDNALPPAPAPK